MWKKHCDGCGNVIDSDEGYFAVNVSFFKSIDQEFEQNPKVEKKRDLCHRCMAKVRPGLDIVDGKTDQ